MTASINFSLSVNMWAKTISFLAPEQQLIASQVSKLWKNASQVPLCRLALMQSISNLQLGQRCTFVKQEPQLIEYLVNLEFNEVLDPYHKSKGEFLARIIESKFESGVSNAMNYLRSLSEENRKLIKSLGFRCLPDPNLDFTEEQVGEILSLCPNLKSLTLSGSSITGECLAVISEKNQLEKLCLVNCRNLNEGFLNDFFQKAAHLKELDLSKTNITGECLANILKENQLEKLCLERCKNLEEQFLAEFFQKAICLKEVNLSFSNTTGEGLAHIPHHQNQLEKLCLKYCENLQEGFLKIFFSKAAHLKEVDLSFSNTTGEGLAHIPHHQNQLEKLYLNSCEKLDEQFFAVALQKVVHLRDLKLKQSFITGECLAFISEENQLEELELYSFRNLKEEFLTTFFSKVFHLKKLDLSGTNITGECLAHLPERNQLESLDVGRCKNLNENFLKVFFLKAAHLRKVEFYGPNSNTTGEGLAHLPERNQLEILDLHYCRNLNENFLKAIFLKAAHLREVNLCGSNTTGAGLAQIPEKNRLEILNLNVCDSLNENFLKVFFLKAAYLRKVEFDSSNTTGEGLAQIPEKNRLENLDLKRCQSLDEVYLAQFFSLKAAHLRIVDLSQTNTTGEGLSRIPENNRLEHLVLEYCRSLAEAHLAQFFSLKAAHLRIVNLYGSNTTGEGLSHIPENNRLKIVLLEECETLNMRLLDRIPKKILKLW
ncbi:MAG: hypothetical protein COT84_00505 [Chlamydiae bacterium CG10_big_fil_rev_8_21_14_0_10_35_9]|nr:MAG: hypothetical protein COT84_00505 [Chlamydiae bacterium CG10_big_fil_rev_8_21_14_0_10_35_9]